MVLLAPLRMSVLVRSHPFIACELMVRKIGTKPFVMLSNIAVFPLPLSPLSATKFFILKIYLLLLNISKISQFNKIDFHCITFSC